MFNSYQQICYHYKTCRKMTCFPDYIIPKTGLSGYGISWGIEIRCFLTFSGGTEMGHLAKLYSSIHVDDQKHLVPYRKYGDVIEEKFVV